MLLSMLCVCTFLSGENCVCPGIDQECPESNPNATLKRTGTGSIIQEALETKHTDSMAAQADPVTTSVDYAAETTVDMESLHSGL